jgi:uncharacterized cupin superfamily protein
MNAFLQWLVVAYAPLHARYALVEESRGAGALGNSTEDTTMEQSTDAFPLVNLDTLDYFTLPVDDSAAERFAARIGDIGGRVGARKLGYNLTVIPPGMRAFPRHSHLVNEEMFFVVSGEGEVRIGDRRRPVRAGDIVACVAGDIDTAHQIANTSADTELRILAVSTMQSPEVCQYPDSGKFALSADLPVPDEGKPRSLRYASRVANSLDYWDGE